MSTPDPRSSEVQRLLAAGERAAAESLLLALHADHPLDDDVMNALGAVALDRGDGAGAGQWFERALATNPLRADSLANLGVAAEYAGDATAAERHYRAALALVPGLAVAAFQLGHLLLRQARTADAHALWWASGRELVAAGNTLEAAALFAELVRLAPHDLDAIGVLGDLYLDLERPAAARSCFERVLELAPERAEAMNALALACAAEGDANAAQRWLRKAIDRRPVFPEAHNNLGNLNARRERSAEAIKHYRLAVAQRPDYADAWVNLADELAWTGEPAAAEAALERCLALVPDHALAHLRLAYSLLARGELAAGWREHLWRFRAQGLGEYPADPRDPNRVLPNPLQWRGASLAGRRVLVLAEEGLGDEVFCLRFAAALRARGAEILYRASPKTYPLLAEHPDLDRVLATTAALPDFDHALAMGDLALVAGLHGGEAVPPPLPLRVTATARQAAGAALVAAADGPYLGLTWRAGKPGDAVRRKAVPVEALAPALRAWPGSLVALQRDATDAELAQLASGSGRPVVDQRRAADTLTEVLPLLAALDDYVGVSNTCVHLLASLGRPGRVLLPPAAEWRWQHAGTRSPWMPSLTIYRCGGMDWGALLARLGRDIVSPIAVTR